MVAAIKRQLGKPSDRRGPGQIAGIARAPLVDLVEEVAAASNADQEAGAGRLVLSFWRCFLCHVANHR